jgi:hypothetical protein
MCLLPTRTRAEDAPQSLAFARGDDGKTDVTRFDPRFFRNLEERLAQLRDLGIEADLILFHPYDEGQWVSIAWDRPTTTATSAMSSRGWLRFAMSGGRWPMSLT